MEHPVCHLNDINGDVLGDIMARFDGLTMAAATCACSGLRDAARDQRLWRQLTSYFLCNHWWLRQVSASQFASLADIFYKKDCVFSKVMDGIPQAMDANYDEGSECTPNVSTDDCRRWYSNCPFKLELLSLENDEGTDFDGELGYADNEDVDQDLGHNANDEERRGFLAMAVAENGNLRHDHSKELEENLRLSWVLLDKKNGTTVNLSSWKPLLVQRSWPFNGDYVLHFGSIIPVEESLLHHKLAKCKIVIRCKPTESGGRPNWREISMQIEDITGASVGGSKSLVVLNHALDCLRSTNHLEVEKGYRQYQKKQRERFSTKSKEFFSAEHIL
ncbi:probable F-box protein At2g36090 [Juglans microcarpa x Juglans regia]|uniref:probable F-box protein At2g36090 n=1 Tax=Juglans microcarpa x Juglans regia TaxID=2249226 RepID=UPI001B7E320E|nr:probable F-box protein At2g36090 [Juglans microcarpa x Juglans regia]